MGMFKRYSKFGIELDVLRTSKEERQGVQGELDWL